MENTQVYRRLLCVITRHIQYDTMRFRVLAFCCFAKIMLFMDNITTCVEWSPSSLSWFFMSHLSCSPYYLYPHFHNLFYEIRSQRATHSYDERETRNTFRVSWLHLSLSLRIKAYYISPLNFTASIWNHTRIFSHPILLPSIFGARKKALCAFRIQVQAGFCLQHTHTLIVKFFDSLCLWYKLCLLINID